MLIGREILKTAGAVPLHFFSALNWRGLALHYFLNGAVYQMIHTVHITVIDDSPVCV